MPNRTPHVGRLLCAYLFGMACLFYLAHMLYWLFRSEWFTRPWFGQLGLFLVGNLVLRFVSKDFDTARMSGERFIARSRWLSQVGFGTVRVIYIAAAPVFRSLCVAVSVFGLYASETYNHGHTRYGISFLAIGMLVILLQVERVIRKVRIEVEARCHGQVVGVHNRRWGVRLFKFSFPAALFAGAGLLIAIAFAIYAFIFSDSDAYRLYAAIALVLTESVMSVFFMLVDLSLSLMSPPVLLPDHAAWDWPTGLFLRSFAQEGDGIGDHLNQYFQFKMEHHLHCGAITTPRGEPITSWLGIGRPGQYLVTPGVQRVALSNESWREWVSAAIDRAALIVVLPANTEGLNWEMNEVSAKGRLSDLRVLVLFGNAPSQFFEWMHQSFGLPGPSLPPFLRRATMIRWENGEAKVQTLAS